MPQQLYIHYHFSRQEIEANDPRDFIELFAPGKFPDRALRHLCDAMEFKFGGYAGETREPYLVPEIRRFLRGLNAQLDQALAFYSETESEFLSLLANCHLDHLIVVDHESSGHVGVQYHPDELEHFIEQGSAAIQRLGKRAAMGAAAISRRQKAFAGYFAERRLWKPGT